MLFNTWLCVLAIAQVSCGLAITTRDEDGVPLANDPAVLKHRGNQESLIAYEKKSRNGKKKYSPLLESV